MQCFQAVIFTEDHFDEFLHMKRSCTIAKHDTIESVLVTSVWNYFILYTPCTLLHNILHFHVGDSFS